MDQSNPYDLNPYGVSQAVTSDSIPAHSQFASFFPGPLVPEDVVAMPYGSFTDPATAISSTGFNYSQMDESAAGPSGSQSSPHQITGEPSSSIGAVAPERVRGVTEEMKERRRRKNRASQAAFRERRKQQIQMLEEQLAALQKRCDNLDARNVELNTQRDEMQAEIEKLQTENQRLRTSLEASPVPDTSANSYEGHLPRPVEPPLNLQQQQHRR